MLKIYLARHGQDEDNAKGLLNGRRDKSLTELGMAQAKELAEKIKSKDIHFDIIYTSPLKRTKQTAKIIAEVLNSERPITLKELLERDFGIMAGEPHTKIIEMCSPNILETEKITYFLSPKGAETFPQLIKRAEKMLNKLERLHKDGNVLLVTHGDFGKMIYATYYKLSWKDVLKQFHFGNSDLLLLSKNSLASRSHIFKIKQHNL
ncbi:hypothetical protein A2715_03490 [Candidatus Woesebacteria bacterium RIFCSPHIGHO2_01_FULL_39_32]|uniref:Phosphoglycerate mutase n=1 Tax=Candidatus Woesebacteria bacterium RIFCSPLOWO2_01_FULL_39_25 TaxID=1802521 RepID=A0A1F8BLS8_9BACT|nr:MAG: hypothetical protein A2124_04795 [Candidatus Woesebacteria bacterium GWB1_37_5]OGM24803.1 MAG: hypothetical protein A2715_03490 [Candidatus Woesebacteria bacterium RIFCSPHIGHO2_01_FULL_39_32]OGM37124.1 MAG: hypothetical protein A3F01_05430 [Candidatus Woesebacteria bacterium RIFCSPHIGHO2_12_FULL_38_11]OGM64629.1 MAG: hypothetical protein A2893_06405 [Candidatus Woesebacteria bacterium RIFCSPLOWO2_01_FULL_39_25]